MEDEDQEETNNEDFGQRADVKGREDKGTRTRSQRGFSPFVYRDRGGWPASLPYIRKIRVSVAIGNQSRIRLHERVPMVKIWGSSKNDQNLTTGKLLNL